MAGESQEHTIQQGDCIASLAGKYGMTQERIWDDPANEQLKQQRVEANALSEGDVVVIPAKRLREETKPTGERHRFRRRGVPGRCRIRVLKYGQPVANASYRFIVDGKTSEGQTDGDGLLTEPIPLECSSGELILDDGASYEFRFGTLDPVDTVVGLQQRLINLGFRCDADGRSDSDELSAAVAAFQRRLGMEPNGRIDSATHKAIQAVHDGGLALPEAPTPSSSEGPS